MSNEPLSILILEDVLTDAELIENQIREAGMQFISHRVSTRIAYEEALEKCLPDIILSDYSLPAFDGLSALKIAVKKCPDIPFIFVTGALGEERVIELLKEGATDYVLKNRLLRLYPAVSRALQGAVELKKQRTMERELKESEARYRTIFENRSTATLIADRNGKIILANRQFEVLTGFSKAEIEGKKDWTDYLPENPTREEGDQWRKRLYVQKPGSGYEAQIVNRAGDILDVLINVATIPPTDQVVLSLLDITESRKMAKEKREASLYARNLIEASLDPLITISAEGVITDVNLATELITGVYREQLIGSRFDDYFTEPGRAQKGYRAVFSKGVVRDYPLAFRHVSGRVTEVHYNASLYRNEAGEIKGVLAALRDVTKQVEAEKKLLASNKLLRSLTWELVITEERERRQIALDLHDHIGQTMALTKLKLETLREQVSGCEGVVGPLTEIAEMVNQSIQQARSLMKNLSPSVLYELGFSEAILWLGEQFESQHGLQVILRNELNLRHLDQEVQLLLFRAIRELLMNVVKHAGVAQALVLLRKSGQNIKVWVKDDGVGFDASTFNQASRRQSDGFGLISIRERIRYIGGRFSIEAKEGQGTCIHIEVPQKSRKQKGGRLKG